MGEQEKNEKAYIPPPSSGGGMGPIGSVGMSSVERVQYIQEIQKASPVSRMGPIKDVKMEGFGLVGDIFSKASAVIKGVNDAYSQIRQSRGEQIMNQHISGLTENVRGVERMRHEFDPQANTDLLDMQKNSQGLYIDSDWTPQAKGQVE